MIKMTKIIKKNDNIVDKVEDYYDRNVDTKE
jgi:hypothetical protein